RVASLIGVNELLPNTPLFTSIGQRFCSDEAITQIICSNVLFIAAGRSEDMHNAVSHSQNLKERDRRYDHGSLANWRIYRSFTPPAYDLKKITAPVFLHYVDEDIFAHVNDVRRLFSELGRPIGMFRVPHATFSHLDFMWGAGAKELVYDRVINLMKSVGDD
ncbi:Lipase, partial [Operophtera brumata]